jgi:iron complex transport system permease protein
MFFGIYLIFILNNCKVLVWKQVQVAGFMEPALLHSYWMLMNGVSLRTLGLVDRTQLTIAIVIVGLLLTIGISLSKGTVSMSSTELWQALLHQGSPINQTIFWELRLPRVAIGLTVGAALGMAGALLQGMLRNSLADPFLLGISAGSGLVVIPLLTLGILQLWVPIAAWIGALVTAMLVYWISKTATGISVERLILGGVAFSALFGAVQTTFLLLAEEGRQQAALNWLVGSLNGRGWQDAAMVSPYVGIALIVGCLLGKTLNGLSLGDDLAVGLGMSLTRSRLLIGAVASLLAASAVSVSGLIGFVGLIVPHAVRLLVGNDYRWILPLSALGGAWVLILADLLARLGVVELPVGAVTALLGSPLFLWLLHRRSHPSRGV